MRLFGKKPLLSITPASGYIAETTGKRTIAHATSIFKTIDPAFKNLKTDVPGPPRERIGLLAYKLDRDATFAEIFEDLIRFGIAENANFGSERILHYPETMDELCFTQDQILTFVEHDEKLRYSQDLVTIMLFESSGLHHVAVIEKRDGELVANHFLLGYVPKWSSVSHPNVVIPIRSAKAKR